MNYAKPNVILDNSFQRTNSSRMEASKVILKMEAISESGWTGPKIFQEKLLSLSEAKALIDQLKNLCLSSREGITIFYQDKVDPFLLQFKHLKTEIIDNRKIVQAFESIYPEGKTGSYDLSTKILLYYLLNPKPRQIRVNSSTVENEHDTDCGQPKQHYDFGEIMSPSALNAFHNTNTIPTSGWKSGINELD